MLESGEKQFRGYDLNKNDYTADSTTYDSFASDRT